MITLERQIRRMRKLWPQFEVTRGLGTGGAVWFGTLVGVARPYRVSVEYASPAEQSAPLLLGGPPIVRVLSPALQLNWYAAEEAPLPHVYFTSRWLELSPLCLFDPDLSEWTPVASRVVVYEEAARGAYGVAQRAAEALLGSHRRSSVEVRVARPGP